MREFASFADFASFLPALEELETRALQGALEKCCNLVEEAARQNVDSMNLQLPPPLQQDAAGEGDDTLSAAEDKEADDRLDALRQELRDSIGHEAAGLEAVIGSTSPVIASYEFGSEDISPSPVLAPALFENNEQIVNIICSAATAGLAGETENTDV